MNSAAPAAKAMVKASVAPGPVHVPATLSSYVYPHFIYIEYIPYTASLSRLALTFDTHTVLKDELPTHMTRD